ncbi:MAG: hypothetical protein HEQ35_31510 [Gloeotrichia echinulata IR180]
MSIDIAYTSRLDKLRMSDRSDDDETNWSRWENKVKSDRLPTTIR